MIWTFLFALFDFSGKAVLILLVCFFLAAISVSTCVTDFFIRLPVSTGGTNFLFVLCFTATVIVLSWKKDAGVTSGLTVNESGWSCLLADLADHFLEGADQLLEGADQPL